MLPCVAIVGRPNVGKSTLFNCLTRSRDALVVDKPGLTRDRKYGRSKMGKRDFWVIDTGGIFGNPDAIETLMQDQVQLAIQEAQVVVFLVDGQSGLVHGDIEIAQHLRAMGCRVIVVANKSERADFDQLNAEFSELGLGEVYAIAAAHWRGVRQLADVVCTYFSEQEPEPDACTNPAIRVAVIGRPNVGKSTLINCLVGSKRVLAFDMPGTTRDSVIVPFERENISYELVDTAGLRRRAKVNDKIEKFSAVKALEAIELAQVVIVVCDAQEGITDQDSHLIGLVIEAGRALVIAINKSDDLQASQVSKVERDLDLKLSYINYARRPRISALKGFGIKKMWSCVLEAHDAAQKKISTSVLNTTFSAIKAHHPPPIVRGRAIRMRYVHLGGHYPPTIVIHGNQLNKLPDSYKRYLENTFRESFGLFGTPLKLQFKTTENPFAGRKNVLSNRQKEQRKRLLKFVKRKK